MGTNVTVVCADAAAYDFPDGALIVYLYNPFDGTVMSSVAQKLRRHTGDLWVTYINPRVTELFENWMEPLPLTPPQAKLFSFDSDIAPIPLQASHSGHPFLIDSRRNWIHC
jgi:hypothetical protein